MDDYKTEFCKYIHSNYTFITKSQKVYAQLNTRNVITGRSPLGAGSSTDIAIFGHI